MAEMRNMLYAPIPGRIPSQASEAREADQFMQFAAAMGGLA